MSSQVIPIATKDNFITCPDLVVTTAGTAVAGASQVSVRGFFVFAHPDNKGNIYVGSSVVTNKSGGFGGMVLAPLGVNPCFIPCTNSNQIFINADNDGDKACLTAN